jgi:succinate dehydrogenase / fumarate reductase cytochrome b subunit
MVPLKKALSSSLGKKYLMAVSGLGIVGFLVTHLLGNLQLFGDGTAFNAYAKALHDLGPGLYVLEAGLAGIFGLHIALAFVLTAKNKGARGGNYAGGQKTKGGPSYSSAGSRNMIVTGVVIMVFLVVHIMHMKFGLFSPEEIATKTTMVGDEQAVDLYARVVDAFKNPGWVFFYVGVMTFVGVHMRHGFWSAFQSLGALNHRLEKPAVALALATAILLAGGFLGIPLYIFATQGLGA